MFCSNCGSEVPEGGKFCSSCGTVMPAEVPLATPAQQDSQKKKAAGSFWRSGAGIALIIIIGVAVIGAIAFGITFLVMGNANNEVDAETVKVWDEYETMLNDNSQALPQITTDQASLAKTQADLKKTQDRVAALEKVLKETGGTAKRRQGSSSTSKRDRKADEMAAALAAYNQYITKMNELFTTLIGANLTNQDVVTKLNQILAELQKLGAKVTVASEKFLADNNKVVTIKIEAPILKAATMFQTDIQKNVTAAQEAEKARLEAEKAAADAAAAEAERQAAAAAEAERQAAAQQQQTQTLDASRCPSGDPFCPI